MKNTKKALATSAVSLLLCFAMLIGTTFAWFTDKVEVTGNRIVAGNLDVELYHTNAAVADEKVTATTGLFTDKLGNEFLWEPGAVIWENFTVENEGNLALKYRLDLIFTDDNHVVRDGVNYKLSDVLKMGIVNGGVTAGDRTAVLAQVTSFAGLASWVENNKPLLKDQSSTVGIVIYWEPSAKDNLYNVNNGAVTSNNNPLAVNFDILLQATQQTEESDAFDNTYDEGAYLVDLPEAGVEVNQNVAWIADGFPGLTINTDYSLKFTVPDNDPADAPYKDWNADFVLTFDKDIKANQVVLIGNHVIGTEALPIMEDVPAGTPVRVMLDTFVPVLGPSVGLDPNNIPANEGLPYETVKFFCGTTGFTCGLTDVKSVLDDNNLTLDEGNNLTGLTLCDESLAGTNVTIELRMYETSDEPGEFIGYKETGVSYIISSYSYTMK